MEILYNFVHIYICVRMSNHITSIVSNKILGQVLYLVLFAFSHVACTQRKSITDDSSGRFTTMVIDTLLPDSTFLKQCKPMSDTMRLRRNIRPLPLTYTLDKLPDTVVRADFDFKDFDWESRQLTFKLFSMDVYDSLEICQMQVGDTLKYSDREIIFNDIKHEDEYLTINNGLYEGGAWLKPIGNGLYRALEEGDCATYTCIGTTSLPLASDFIVVDFRFEPEEGDQYYKFHLVYDTITSSTKEYIRSKECDSLYWNAWEDLLVENDSITKIIRFYTP